MKLNRHRGHLIGKSVRYATSHLSFIKKSRMLDVRESWSFCKEDIDVPKRVARQIVFSSKILQALYG